jgi:predicted CoA-binding protein
MTTGEAIADFFDHRKLAVVGISRQGRKFGNLAFKELKAKGFHLYPVHPSAESVEGTRCFPSLAALPEPVDGVLIVVPPRQTEKIVREAAAAGIRRVWMQQGAESPEAIQFCEAQGMSVIHGECVLMFAEPAKWFHRTHRWVWRVLGRLPH